METINGHKLDTTDLAPQFEEFYRTGQRIEVEPHYGIRRRGYVGKTMGWKPSYILLARRDSISSSDLLGHEDRVAKRLPLYRYR